MVLFSILTLFFLRVAWFSNQVFSSQANVYLFILPQNTLFYYTCNIHLMGKCYICQGIISIDVYLLPSDADAQPWAACYLP